MRADLHCDTLTAATGFSGHVELSELRAEKAFQCFAAFTENDEAAAYAAAIDLFRRTFTPENGFARVKTFSDVEKAEKAGLACCALTCENIGFTGGDYANIARLKNDGVIMASLVWNGENRLAYPNVRADGRRERRGLKDKGVEAAEALDSLKIIVDISHLSDGGAEQILENRKIPAVASHSNCNAVCRNARNLTDFQLKKIADCGGAVGVNFYNKFLCGERAANGPVRIAKESAFGFIAAHLKHMIDVAGEDTPAFGSDWDGVPRGGISVLPEDMPGLYGFLKAVKLPGRVLDKIFYKNFLRVLKQVTG